MFTSVLITLNMTACILYVVSKVISFFLEILNKGYYIMFTPETHKKQAPFRKHKYHGKPPRDKKQTVVPVPEDYKPSTTYLREDEFPSNETRLVPEENLVLNTQDNLVEETVALMDNLDLMFKLSSQLPKVKFYNQNEVFDLKVLKFGEKIYTTNLLNRSLFRHLMDDAPYTEAQLLTVCQQTSHIANYLTAGCVTLEKVNYKEVYSRIAEFSKAVREKLNNKAYFSVHHEFTEKDGKIIRTFYLVYSRKNVFTKEYDHIAARLFSLSSVKL